MTKKISIVENSLVTGLPTTRKTFKQQDIFIFQKFPLKKYNNGDLYNKVSNSSLEHSSFIMQASFLTSILYSLLHFLPHFVSTSKTSYGEK